MKKDVKQNPEAILAEKIEGLQRRREWKQFLLGCVLLVLVFYVVFQYVIGIAFVNGRSMEPELGKGELVVFYRLERQYGKTDIVVFKRGDGGQEIKRIAACGGERIELNGEGQLLADGQECLEAQPVKGGIAFPYDVPEGTFFVLGDNQAESEDSRSFGAVGRDELVGRVFLHLGLTR